VCWSDKVMFEVGEDGSIYYVTRGLKEGCLRGRGENLRPTFKSGRTSVGVWSCYCRDEMGPLVIIEKGGRMTGKRYLKTVEKYFLPFYKRMVRKHRPR
jgi:hypothetical protein